MEVLWQLFWYKVNEHHTFNVCYVSNHCKLISTTKQNRQCIAKHFHCIKITAESKKKYKPGVCVKANHCRPCNLHGE